MYERKLDLVYLLKKRSYFLFGPRATGKSTLIKQQLPKAKIYDLLDPKVFERLIKNPGIISFDLIVYLNSTGLPEFFGDELARDFLQAYVGTYLKEEIQAEALTRNLAGFARFLEVCSGVNVKTVESYFQILEDTLIGFKVSSFRATVKRKAILKAKHYFFDVGVVNSLSRRRKIELKSELLGKAFEH